jgi:hypothetical protein
MKDSSCGICRRVTLIRTDVALLVTANVVPSSLILFALIMDAAHSSETSVLTRATRRHIPENGILHYPVYVHLTVEILKVKVRVEEWCLLGCYAVWLL